MLNNAQVNKLIKARLPHVKPTDIVIVGVRGNEGPNRIGVFDDRCYVTLGAGTDIKTWKFNTDPTSQIEGRANLKPGVWKYRVGKHHIASPPPKGRPGLVQAAEVTVYRYGQGDDTGWFGINFHNVLGGTTSSEGCQTFNPDEWQTPGLNGFFDVILRLAKVTARQAMENPSGVGPVITYLLFTAKEVAEILK